MAEVGWELEEGGGSKCSQGKGDADFGGVYQLSEDNVSGVGGIAANIRGVLKGDRVRRRGEAL